MKYTQENNYPKGSMSKTIINPSKKFPISVATINNSTVYVSGQIGMDLTTGKLVDGGIVEETRQALTNLKTALESAGSSLSHVLKTTVFMTDLTDYTQMNEIYREFFTHDYPARSAVQVNTLPANAQIEIECIAALITNS